MTEHKFTDEEIKKGLERVISCNDRQIANCEGCPFEKAYPYCDDEIEVECLALINRYEAEIERLNERERILIYHVAVERERAIKEFAERLNAQFSDMENQPPSDRKIIRINEVKSLMDWILHDITKQVIAEVVKEMTGETKAETDFPKDYSYGY